MAFNKRNRRHDDHNLDDWLMTYADMITLLLCFFAIFLSVSVPKKDAFEQARSKVLEKFAAVDIVKGKFSPTTTPTGTAIPIQAGPDRAPDVARGETDEETESPQQKKDMKKAPDKAGDRLSTIDMNSASFFASGQATLSDEGKKILDGVLVMLRSDKYEGYRLTIEGHTDDSPINTLQFPSNWELSTARAAAVARYFIEQGVEPQRLRASGYADTFPKVPNRDASGKPIPENQAQNRRVVIKLEKVEKAE